MLDPVVGGVGERLGQRLGVVPWTAVGRADGGEERVRAEGLGPAAQPVGRRDGAVSATTTSRRRRGACAASTSRCCSGENPAVSPGCGARLRTRTLRASLSTRASSSSGTSRWGRTLDEPRPRPQDDDVRGADGVARLRARPRPARGRSRTRCTRPGVVATATWPRIRWATSRPWSPPSGPKMPVTSASMSTGCVLIGSTRPRTPSRRQAWSSAATGSSRTSSRPASSRLPTAWPGERPGAAEAVLEDPLPQRVLGPGVRPGRPAHRAPSAGRPAAGCPARGGAARTSRRRRRPSRRP